MNKKQQKYILTLDEGTSSCRTVICDKKANLIGFAQQKISTFYPNSGWVELDPVEILNSQKTTFVRAKRNSGITPDQIQGVGISNQRETIVMWNKKTGYPVYNAIVWSDGRTVEYCENLIKNNSKLENIVREKTGLIISPYFSASKINWILNNVDKAKAALASGDLLCGTIDTWLIWNLTVEKKHVTDISNASRTMLFNIHTQTWDQELLKIFGIPSEILPKVQPSGSVFGHLIDNIFSTPTVNKVPIAAVLGDQQASLFGHLCFKKGQIKCTYGTGCFALVNTGTKPVNSNNRLLTTVAWQIEGQPVVYALEGSVFSAGSSLNWLHEPMQLIDQINMADNLAFSINDDQKIYMVPAFNGLGAPYWDTTARTLIIGLERNSTPAHIVKATLEGIAYECHELFNCMEHDLSATFPEVAVDGGITASKYLMQFQSDISNKNILIPRSVESTALGAVFMAGLTVKYWQSMDELSTLNNISEKFVPTMQPELRTQLLDGWFKVVKLSLNYLK